ncbi:hypothetical protein B0G77_8472 [Paraburkholderia sp. BL10I2N1]|nr:hypothetical protein B0G77_8472 [Paraburkholderia sp. BL10I2N1]
MYLLYSDLCGALADYSLSPEAPRVDASLPCEDACEVASSAAVAAHSRWASLRGRFGLLRFVHKQRNGSALSPADMYEGERS